MSKQRSEFFRAGVGVVVANADGRWLALRRVDAPEEAWQLPQGGIEIGEDPETAMWRELEEETGLGRQHCELLAVSEGWLAYELPEAFRSSKFGRGQVQRWYLCRFAGEDADIRPDGREFDSWKWVAVETLLDEVVAFRRPVYRTLAVEFAGEAP